MQVNQRRWSYFVSPSKHIIMYSCWVDYYPNRWRRLFPIHDFGIAMPKYGNTLLNLLLWANETDRWGVAYKLHTRLKSRYCSNMVRPCLVRTCDWSYGRRMCVFQEYIHYVTPIRHISVRHASSLGLLVSMQYHWLQIVAQESRQWNFRVL